MAGTIERRELTFRGRVQGVGFRVSTRALAQGFEVTGWVRNEPDGSVRVEVQGSAAELDLFIQAIHARMPGHISSTEVRLMAPRGDESHFEVFRERHPGR